MNEKKIGWRFKTSRIREFATSPRYRLELRIGIDPFGNSFCWASRAAAGFGRGCWGDIKPLRFIR